MSTGKKTSVKWKIPEADDRTRPETPSEQYVYSNTFEESVADPVYSDTFINDSYSDTFVSEITTAAHGSRDHGKPSTFGSFKSKRGEHTVSFDDSEISTIQEATYLETARNVTEMLETVLEVDSSDLSRTQDIDSLISDTQPPASYTDTFESSERTRLDSRYDSLTQDDSYTEVASSTLSYTPSDTLSPSRSPRTTRSSMTRKSTWFTEAEDDSMLDRSFIAPDYNGKSVSDDDTDDDTLNDDYSLTFEPTLTESTSQISATETGFVQMSAEDAKLSEEAKRQFTEDMIERLRNPSKVSRLQFLPPDPADEVPKENDYVKHFCKKKIKLLKMKKHGKPVEEKRKEAEVHPLVQQKTSTSLADYGIPESVMDRAKIANILSAMKKVATEEIHEPRKCSQCINQRQVLDSEEAERRFIRSQTMRLKNKIMDVRVEEHLLKNNTVSLIADIARDLPYPTEKPEKIFDKLFEPLLGKNVMR